MATDLVSGDADVRAILADPAYLVPPAAPSEQTGTLGWLRALVARFSDGAEHDRRRALVKAEIRGLDPARLRRRAASLTAEQLSSGRGEPLDAMTLARRIPVAVLAGELGVGPEVTAATVNAVLAAAPGYPNPDLAGPDADSSVSFLADVLGPADPELLANRIGLLMQACDATAGLIGNALITAFASAGPAEAGPAAAAPAEASRVVDETVDRTVAEDPPVLRTRRLSPDGEVVTLDISACPFGAGRRPCPGADQAIALASGVLDAITGAYELADQQIEYLPSPNLRIPVKLLITPTDGAAS